MDTSKIRFPKRRSDGTFCAEMVLTVTESEGEALGHAIQQWWNEEWARANRTWTRRWSSGAIDELLYADDFSTTPQVVSCVQGELRVRLEGTRSFSEESRSS
jgi:hypothetical protein